MLSAMFSHDPPKGVYKGITPCANSHSTNSGVLCPAKLSNTSNMRSGGGSAGSVIGHVRPACQRSQDARHDTPGGTGSGTGRPARTPVRPRFSQAWRTALVVEVAPSTSTRPDAGWNSVSTLAVPLRTYSCGCRAGSPSGRHDPPGCGTVWNGPASSQHQTGRSPAAPPRAYASSISFFWARRPGR